MIGSPPVSLAALVHRLAEGDALPSEVIASALRAVDDTDPLVQAWVAVDRDAALAAGRTLDGSQDAGLLRGIPFGVKDTIDVAGMVTACGSPLREGRVTDRDAWVVGRLRQSGAVPLGKTVTTEFAYFAPGPTRNPRHLGHTPGGSSSGSAAAVAAGVVPLALGSQTAGSLTRPAAFCGVAGFVAPVGSIPTTGVTALSPTLDTLGLLTASVADLGVAMAALSGAARLPEPPPPPERPRLLLWTAAEIGGVDEAMHGALVRTAAALRARGAVVDVFDWSERIPRLVEAHTTVMTYEAARALHAEARHPDQLSDQLRALIAEGQRIPKEDYRSALLLGESSRAELLAVLGEHDAVLLGPAALGAAPHGLRTTGSPVLSRPWQLLGLPVVTVPGCRDPYGLPLGLQVVGRPERVERLLHLGDWIEQVIRDRSRPEG